MWLLQYSDGWPLLSISLKIPKCTAVLRARSSRSSWAPSNTPPPRRYRISYPLAKTVLTSYSLFSHFPDVLWVTESNELRKRTRAVRMSAWFCFVLLCLLFVLVYIFFLFFPFFSFYSLFFKCYMRSLYLPPPLLHPPHFPLLLPLVLLGLALTFPKPLQILGPSPIPEKGLHRVYGTARQAFSRIPRPSTILTCFPCPSC